MRRSSSDSQMFDQALDAYLNWEDGEPEPSVTDGEQTCTLSEICGRLWHCTDIMEEQFDHAI